MTDPSPTQDLVAALAAMTEVEKKGKADIGRSRQYRYMELPDLLQAVRTTLAGHRLAVMQELHAVDRDVTVVTVLVHTSGERFSSPPLTIHCDGTAHGIGSAATYGRRYSLAAFIGLAGSDDDDAGLANTAPPPPPPKPAVTTPAGKRVTDDQLRKLHAQLGDLDERDGRHTDANERRIIIATAAGIHPDSIQTARELTTYQASKAIEHLAARLEDTP